MMDELLRQSVGEEQRGCWDAEGEKEGGNGGPCGDVVNRKGKKKNLAVDSSIQLVRGPLSKKTFFVLFFYLLFFFKFHSC